VLHCCPLTVQSVLERHATQVFVPVSHCGAAVVVQSAFATHATQVFVAVSHTGRAGLPQSAAVWHPPTQEWDVVSQRRLVAPQFVVFRHCTQFPEGTSQ
jgi:ureidoglycolate hydrolase